MGGGGFEIFGGLWGGVVSEFLADYGGVVYNNLVRNFFNFL